MESIKRIRRFIGSTAASLFLIILGSHPVLGSVTPNQLGMMLLGPRYSRVSGLFLDWYPSCPKANGEKGGFHTGIDYSAAPNTPVYSPVDGELADTGHAKGRISVKIRDSEDFFIFLHLCKFHVLIGQKIEVGCLIGESGSVGVPEGKEAGPHLHVEVRTGRMQASDCFATKDNAGANKDPTSVIEYYKRVSPSRCDAGADARFFHGNEDPLANPWRGTIGTMEVEIDFDPAPPEPSDLSSYGQLWATIKLGTTREQCSNVHLCIDNMISITKKPKDQKGKFDGEFLGTLSADASTIDGFYTDKQGTRQIWHLLRVN